MERKTPDMRFIFAVNLLPITPTALPSYADDTEVFRVQASCCFGSQNSNCAGCQFSIGRGIFFILVDFLLGKRPMPMAFPCFFVVAFYFSCHTMAVCEKNQKLPSLPAFYPASGLIIKKFLL